MQKLQILMPLGGLGKRFSDKGYSLPKPIIPVDGVPMFQKALSAFSSLNLEIELIAVFRRVHEEEFKLSSLLKRAYPKIKIVLLEELTRGAMETCLFSQSLIDLDARLVILDCDLWFDAPKYMDLINNSQSDPTYAGALVYFEATSPRYSFIRVSNGVVTEIAEKKAISNCAVIGSYFFSKASTFFNVAHELMKSPPLEASEYYISAVYKKLISQNFIFMATKSQGFYSFGTPEELNAYEQLTASRQQ